MIHRKRLFILILMVMALSSGFAWQASLASSLEAAQATVNEEPITRGEACGNGELLPDTTMCLHGTVWEEQADGSFDAAEGALITVRSNTHTVTGTAYIHPGHSVPHYGIDIAPLEPAYLKSVTVTVSFKDWEKSEQIVVFPNYATMSQQHDIWLRSTSSFDDVPVWGRVIDFESGGAVAGATVTATLGTETVVVPTANELGTNANPTFYLTNTDLNTLGANAGDIIHLVASYNGNSNTQLITLSGDEPQQTDFILGWRCSDFDPLPRTQGGWGFPRTQGGWGFPDMACFWGRVKVAGDYPEGVEVQLTISETGLPDFFQGLGGLDTGGDAVNGRKRFNGYACCRSMS